MVEQQNQAEKSQTEAEKHAVQLEKKSKEIAERKIVVENDLGKAEPALIAAQQSVSGI